MPERDRDAERRHELASFLRSAREAVRPEDVGLLAGGRRRVRGLRRHEVSDLAGVSNTWYTWLEQGRPIHASPEVLDGLARALRLDQDQHRYLRRLGGSALAERPQDPREINAGIAALAEALLPSPVHVTTPTWDLLLWNRAYACLYGDPAALPVEQRNALWIQLLNDDFRNASLDWEQEAIFAIGRFRAEAGKYPGDTRIKAIVADLLERSDLFRRHWAAQEVHRFRPWTQVIRRDDVGLIRMRMIQLRPLDQPSLVLMVHQAADDRSRVALSTLSGINTPPRVSSSVNFDHDDEPHSAD